MEQLLCHLFADYWLQNDSMALNKKKYFWIALVHAIVYTIPFLLLTKSILALSVICITHAIIDHTDIVCGLNQIKNWDFSKHTLKTQTVHPFGFPLFTDFFDGYSDRPIFIRVWLIIIQDNILHLIINYCALRWL
jgi:hypothetical protein